jgi:hypothetical protein
MHIWRIVTRIVPQKYIQSATHGLAKRLVARARLSGGRFPELVERLTGISLEMYRLRLAEARYTAALNALQPDVLCLSEDFPGSFTPPLVKVARELRIPTVVIPFTIPNAREVLEDCFSKSLRDLWLGDYIADYLALHMYPRWTMMYKGRVLWRARGRHIISSERAGIAPPCPWVLNSGFVDRIAVESEQMLSIYRNADFPSRQLVLTGSASDDMLYEAMAARESSRSSLYEELGLQKDLPLLLTSLVPNQFDAMPFCEFDRYDVMLEFWVNALAKWRHRYNVVLKVNPRTPWQDFLYLERLGAKVAPHDTIKLMPFAEIYVASISSTLRWATACGIPCINYDVYHYRYGDYLAASGILHVEKKEDFTAAVDRLAGDNEYRETMRRRQVAQAASWGRLDGRSTERLAALFDELQALHPRPSEPNRGRNAAEIPA